MIAIDDGARRLGEFAFGLNDGDPTLHRATCSSTRRSAAPCTSRSARRIPRRGGVEPVGAPLGHRLRPAHGQRGLRGRRARLPRRAFLDGVTLADARHASAAIMANTCSVRLAPPWPVRVGLSLGHWPWSSRRRRPGPERRYCRAAIRHALVDRVGGIHRPARRGLGDQAAERARGSDDRPRPGAPAAVSLGRVGDRAERAERRHPGELRGPVPCGGEERVDDGRA